MLPLQVEALLDILRRASLILRKERQPWTVVLEPRSMEVASTAGLSLLHLPLPLKNIIFVKPRMYVLPNDHDSTVR